MIVVSLTPAPQNRRYAAQLREPSTADLKRRNVEALKTAGLLMGAGVVEDMGQYMPHRGGYAAVLAGALRTTVRVSGGGVVITGRAKGKRNSRDIRSLERGRLRHPLYGRRHSRRGKSLMFDTTVKPGFFTEPITRRAHIARDKLVEVMQQVARQVTRG